MPRMADSIGSFQVMGPLGTGAHSTILHIRRSSDSKQYALKIVPIEEEEDKKYLEQAEHEFAVAQKLHHDNLIKIYALEKIKKFLFFGVREVRLLIEYVPGKTLDKFKVLALPKLVQIFEKVASGLAHMHRREICHADLKPHNIMLGKGGQVKIIDYGLAWMKGEQKDRVQGTPEYMAPEQAKQRIVNPQTDLFNFGATMYRLCTWKNIAPVVEQDGTPVPGKIWERSLRPVQELKPNIPDDLAKLIQRCLSYKPAGRPESATDMHQELQQIVEKVVRSPEDDLETMEWEE
jgi:serine/threonine protein kinase